MRFGRGMVLALMTGATLAGCAAAGVGGPSISPTGKIYEPGTPPSSSDYTQQATLAVAQGAFDRALEQAQMGIAQDSTNPQHYYLAGEAAAGLGDYALADSMWNIAQRIYPAYEMEIEPARESAWAEAFNVGVEAYNAGDAEGAIEAWSGAMLIYPYRPGAAQNLAIVLTQEARYEEAIDVYREALAAMDLEPQTRFMDQDELAEREESAAFMRENLAQLLLYTDQFAEAESLLREQLEADPDNVELRTNLANALSRQGRDAEAGQIYTDLLSNPSLTPDQLFSIGVLLFNGNEYVRAAEALGRVTESMPESRDAWYNQANALYAAEEWEALVPIAERLVEVDPLSENTALILARSYRELERNTEALAALERLQELPVYVEELQMQPSAAATTINGRVIGNAAAAGTPIRLEFTFYGPDGALGTETVTINAPAAEASTPFQVQFDQVALGYSYRPLP